MSSPISTLEENAMYNLAPNPSPDQAMAWIRRALNAMSFGPLTATEDVPDSVFRAQYTA